MSSVSLDVYNDYDQDTGQYASMETYPALSTGASGEYSAVIPSAPASTDNVQNFCENVVGGITDACDIYDKLKKITKGYAEKGICTVLAGVVVAVAKVPSAAVAAYKICRKSFKSVSKFCGFINKATSVPGIDTAEVVCGAVTGIVDNFIDYFIDSFVRLTPRALIDGSIIVGTSKILKLQEGSTTSLSIIPYEVQTPQITSYYAIPYDPVPGEFYTAYVYYTCATDLVQIIMTIVGTDGYTGSTACTGGSSCQLNVPGAMELVVDTVTVTITEPLTQQSTQRVIYIVF